VVAPYTGELKVWDDLSFQKDTVFPGIKTGVNLPHKITCRQESQTLVCSSGGIF